MWCSRAFWRAMSIKCFRFSNMCTVSSESSQRFWRWTRFFGSVQCFHVIFAEILVLPPFVSWSDRLNLTVHIKVGFKSFTDTTPTSERRYTTCWKHVLNTSCETNWNDLELFSNHINITTEIIPLLSFEPILWTHGCLNRKRALSYQLVLFSWK